MFDLLAFAGCVAGGYVLAIYTWPPVRHWLTGAEAEIKALRDRARELEARLRKF